MRTRNDNSRRNKAQGDGSKFLFSNRPIRPLPSVEDFDPWGGDLDARHAWKSFGGLSLAQAHELFHYQEDFMFMGPKTFAYYFPVIDRYLREVHGEDSGDDCCAWILGNAIAKQLEEAPDLAIQAIAEEAVDLASHVIGNPGRYTPDGQMQERVLREWSNVARVAAEILRP
jgi:hypothetical protein